MLSRKNESEIVRFLCLHAYQTPSVSLISNSVTWKEKNWNTSQWYQKSDVGEELYRLVIGNF